MPTITIRIRGIYTTALTKLFLEGGFGIAQPSRPIQERFGLEANFDPYDVDLYDLEDRQGVFLSGSPKAVEAAVALLRKELPDVIVQQFEHELYAVYRGVARSSGERGTLVELGRGQGVGLLPEQSLHPGEAVTVQICKLPDRGQEPILRQMIGIPGRYAVLISTARLAVSKEIRDQGERMRLIWLGAELAPRGWGIVWHTAAQGRSRSTLSEDVKRLARLAEELREREREGQPPCLLLPGERAVQLEFPGGSKRRLDELRSQVLPTVACHHKAKASGREGDIDTLEQMVRKLSRSREKGKGLISISTAATPALASLPFPQPGATLTIEHVKLDGQVQVLGRGAVVRASSEEGLVEVEREIKTPGSYDGLGVAKEPGDKAVTEFVEGRWYYKTSYYSASGELKGEYYNINTPLEIYPDRVRYVDLEIDVVRLPGSEPRVIDEEKLEEAVKRGQITEKLAAQAREVARGLAASSTATERPG